MYIKNIDLFPKTIDLFHTNKIVSDYLVAHGIPLLGVSGKQYSFSCSPELKNVLDKVPLWMKPLFKTPPCYK